MYNTAVVQLLFRQKLTLYQEFQSFWRKTCYWLFRAGDALFEQRPQPSAWNCIKVKECLSRTSICNTMGSCLPVQNAKPAQKRGNATFIVQILCFIISFHGFPLRAACWHLITSWFNSCRFVKIPPSQWKYAVWFMQAFGDCFETISKGPLRTFGSTRADLILVVAYSKNGNPVYPKSFSKTNLFY